MDRIEFYTKNGGVAAINSSIVPPKNSFISLRGVTYRVARVTFAFDHADKMPSERVMRANVDLEQVKP